MPVDLGKLTQPFPKQAIKQREGGGGRRYDYVEAHTVIHRLNEATGNNWTFEVVSLEWRNDLLIALGRLEIPGHGSRMGIGVQKVSAGGGEDLVKGAASDALKKAATLFGVALELYGPDYEAGELDTPQPQRPVRSHGGRTAQAAANAARRDAEQSAAAQIAPAYGHATPNQAKFIAQLLRELEWNREDCERFLDANYGVHRVSELGSRQDVSTFIERLQAVKGANEPAAV